jgi:hypothetical protein
MEKMVVKQKNMGSRSSPCTRFSRNASDYDLHENGRWVAAPDHYCSQHPPSVKAGAGGLQTGKETNVPNKKMWVQKDTLRTKQEVNYSSSSSS